MSIPLLKKMNYSKQGTLIYRSLAASRENAQGQQDILRALANHSGNCSRAMVQKLTGLDQTIINDALQALFRQEVIVERQDNLTFAVELFHRWVVKYRLEE